MNFTWTIETKLKKKSAVTKWKYFVLVQETEIPKAF